MLPLLQSVLQPPAVQSVWASPQVRLLRASHGQPEAESKIRTTLMLGLVFIETAIIYALLVVILIIFVL